MDQAKWVGECTYCGAVAKGVIWMAGEISGPEVA